MISFRDSARCPLFQEFLESEFVEGLSEKSEEFLIVLPEDRQSGFFYSEDFMAINSRMVFYNATKCDEFGLALEERYACLAHELGHYYDPTLRELQQQQLREENADNFAVELGLGRYLASALEKIQEAVDEGTRMLIQERIDRLRNLGFGVV